MLARLAAGKVYVPEQIEHAARNFFRKGNLMALRELALRRTADRIEDDVQAYRVKQAIEPVWKTEASLLCGVGPRPGGEGVIRNAARLASQLGVDWMAVYVETPRLQRLPAAAREGILRTLKLAQDMGARTAVLSGADPAAVLVDYARSHNCSKLVLGRTRAKPWLRILPSLISRVGVLARTWTSSRSVRRRPRQSAAPRATTEAPTTRVNAGRKRWRAYSWTVLPLRPSRSLRHRCCPISTSRTSS